MDGITAVVGFGVGLFIAFVFIIGLIVYVINALTYYKLSKKAGLDSHAWMAWVPVLQNVLFFHMIDKSGWYVLLYLIPSITLVFDSGIMAVIGLILNLAVVILSVIWLADLLKRFGQSPLWIITLFIPIINIAFIVFFIYMAFSNDVQYQSTNRYQDGTQNNYTYY